MIGSFESYPAITSSRIAASRTVRVIGPNVSLTGQPGRTTMMSIILPGATPDTSEVLQIQYSRTPIDTPEKEAELEARRAAGHMYRRGGRLQGHSRQDLVAERNNPNYGGQTVRARFFYPSH